MNSLETFTTHPDYTLPLAEPLPKFSMKPERMDGVTHQQWLNSYLERRMVYIEDAVSQHRKPTVNEFHVNIANITPGATSAYTHWLAKVSGVIQRVADPDIKHKRSIGLHSVAPSLLTEQGAARVIQELGDTRRNAPSAVEAREERIISRSEFVGRFVLDNGFKILDPITGTIINPKSLIEFDQT